MTMQVIQHIELGSSASSITFSSIAGTFTDLLLVTSLRGTNSDATAVYLQFNGSSTGYSARRLLGDGSSASSTSFTTAFFAGVTGSSFTANTFTNDACYIPNYAGSNQKSYSSDHVTENNSSTSFQALYAGLWTGTDAITSLVITPFTGSFAAGSSATLFGITKGSSGGVTVS